MIDHRVRQLLWQAVDSPLKLHLLLTFYEHSGLEITAARMAERTCRDVWSVTQALGELAEDGILHLSQAYNEPVYYYHPRPEYLGPISQLIQDYNDPLERRQLHRSLRDLADAAALRRSAGSETVY